MWFPGCYVTAADNDPSLKKGCALPDGRMFSADEEFEATVDGEHLICTCPKDLQENNGDPIDVQCRPKEDGEEIPKGETFICYILYVTKARFTIYLTVRVRNSFC